MLIDLAGQVAIVTGGGRGIGLTIARTLAAEGVATVVIDVREDLLAEVRAEWSANGWQGDQLICNVASLAETRATVEKVEQRFGRIDILVNNAGVGGGGRVEAMEEAAWDRAFEVNLKGTMLMSQAVIPAMKRRRRGRILNAASFAAIIPSLASSAYAASKAAVVSLTRVMAGELGPYEITVNCYAPGMIPTELNHFAEAPPERQAMLLDTLSLRRWGDPQDVANLICFLSSGLAGYITGTMIDVSGGKYATQLPWLAHREA